MIQKLPIGTIPALCISKFTKLTELTHITMKLTQTLLTAAALSCFAYTASAAVTFEFANKEDIFDGYTSVDVMITDVSSTLMTVTATGGTLNSNSGDFGVDGSEPDEVNDFIDGTSESITLTFSTEVIFNWIDLAGIGTEAQTDDHASITIAGTQLNLSTGVDNFNGSTDVYTPASPITLAIGESIILTGTSSTSSFELQGINLTVVPEPGTFALLAGFSALSFVMLRRRSVK